MTTIMMIMTMIPHTFFLFFFYFFLYALGSRSNVENRSLFENEESKGRLQEGQRIIAPSRCGNNSADQKKNQSLYE